MVTFIAHRGDCQFNIENTLHSVKAAIDGGITAIEIDIQFTKDGIPILYHDRDLTRLLNTKGVVADYYFSEISTAVFTCPKKLARQAMPESEFITSLAMLVDYLKQFPAVSLFVEVKRINFKYFSRQTVYHLLEKVLLPIKSQVTYISFCYRFLRYCRMQSMMPLGYVLPSWQQFNDKMLGRLQPQFIFSDVNIVPSSYQFQNDKLQNMNFHWALYEVVDITMAQHFIDRGVKYLETFTPTALKQQYDTDAENRN